jgi:pantoate--beta-alanine ligase
MRTLRTVAELRESLEPVRRAGQTVGLVPTMGALHEGHLSLIRQAAADCDVVVMSLFVNPAQFNERSDLEGYPRSEPDDAEMAAAAGADLLFAPSVEEVYPRGFSTAVEVFGLTERMEGASRGAAHFRGVTTVVAKLLAMAQPDVAYFGRKDAQQLVVIRRLVADLNLPVRVEGLATVREPDGLAMSSRNALLRPEDRERALALSASLRAAAAVAASGERSARMIVAAASLTLADAAVEAEYIELVDPETLEPISTLIGPGLLALAARIGNVRLIDNTTLEPLAGARSDQYLPGEAFSCNA